MTSYYEEMYGMQSFQRGYLASYQSVLSLMCLTFLIQPILRLLDREVFSECVNPRDEKPQATHGQQQQHEQQWRWRHRQREYKAACTSAGLLTLATFLELQASLPLFLVVISPLIALATSMLHLTLQSLVTQVAPAHSLGSVLAALDVLQNAVAVTVPLYRTGLFWVLQCTVGGGEDDPAATMLGDPCPDAWLKSSGMHWLVATVAMSGLLLGRRGDESIGATDRAVDDGKKLQ